MPIMNWEPRFDVKVEEMNREHRQILDAMNAIYDAVEAGQKGPGVMAKIARLGEVTTRHFADEEAYMQRIGYPGFDTHQAIHKKLLRDFGDHAARAQAAGGVPASDFFSFLRLWLTAHICCIDIKYGQHAASKRAA